MNLKIILKKLKKKISDSKNLDLKALQYSSSSDFSEIIYLNFLKNLNRSITSGKNLYMIENVEYYNEELIEDFYQNFIERSYFPNPNLILEYDPSSFGFFQKRPIASTLFFIVTLYFLRQIIKILAENLLKRDWTDVNKAYFVFLLNLELKIINFFLRIKGFLFYLGEKIDSIFLFLQKISTKNKNSFKIKKILNSIFFILMKKKQKLKSLSLIDSKPYVTKILKFFLEFSEKFNRLGLRLLGTILVFYFPFMYLLKESLSPSFDPNLLNFHFDILAFTSENVKLSETFILWPKAIIDYNIFNCFCFLPGFKTVIIPFFSSGFRLLTIDSFYIILLYILVILKIVKKKKLGFNFGSRYNCSLATAFMMLVSSIQTLKLTIIQYLYKIFFLDLSLKSSPEGMMRDIDFFFFYKLPLFLSFPISTLAFFALIYHCLFYVVLGKRTYIPIISNVAKFYLEEEEFI